MPQQAHSRPGAAVSHRERLRTPGPAAPEELQQARRLPEVPRGSPSSCTAGSSARALEGKAVDRRGAAGVGGGGRGGKQCCAELCRARSVQRLSQQAHATHGRTRHRCPSPTGATCCSQLGGPNVPAMPGDLCPKLLPAGAPTGLRLPVPPLPRGDLSVVHKQVWKLNASLMSMGLGWGKASPAHA